MSQKFAANARQVAAALLGAVKAEQVVEFRRDALFVALWADAAPIYMGLRSLEDRMFQRGQVNAWAVSLVPAKSRDAAKMQLSRMWQDWETTYGGKAHRKQAPRKTVVVPRAVRRVVRDAKAEIIAKAKAAGLVATVTVTYRAAK